MSPGRTVVTSVVLALLVNGMFAASAAAQELHRSLRPPPTGGLPVVPFMEGWYSNADGSVTVSFGYDNRNKNDVYVPRGADNRIDPPSLDGMQPEVFYQGRQHGVFAVTIPASMREDTIWWHIKSGKSDALSVPGELGSTAYELDRNPRPQGSLQPLIWFQQNNPGTGPEGVVSPDVKTVAVGVPLTLEVGTEDPSVRDPSNPLFAKPLDTRVIWYRHQGPGEVQFTEDPSTPFMTTPFVSLRGQTSAPASRIAIPGGKGPARVVATFPEPGDYMIRARLDNWNASDSDGYDQCCWSHAFQRVRVTE